MNRMFSITIRQYTETEQMFYNTPAQDRDRSYHCLSYNTRYASVPYSPRPMIRYIDGNILPAVNGMNRT